MRDEDDALGIVLDAAHRCHGDGAGGGAGHPDAERAREERLFLGEIVEGRGRFPGRVQVGDADDAREGDEHPCQQRGRTAPHVDRAPSVAPSRRKCDCGGGHEGRESKGRSRAETGRWRAWCHAPRSAWRRTGRNSSDPGCPKFPLCSGDRSRHGSWIRASRCEGGPRSLLSSACSRSFRSPDASGQMRPRRPVSRRPLPRRPAPR